MSRLSLALDCSTALGGVVLAASDGRVVACEEFLAGRGRGGELFLKLERTLHTARAVGGTPGQIVVGLGPGSYSGVRQTIAAAVGLATATGATLAGVPSVLALRGAGERYQTVGDARRGTYYYTAVCERTCVAGPELLLDLASLHARLAEHPGWPVCVVETPLPDGVLADAPVLSVDTAALLAVPAAARLAPPLEPIYLRPVSVTLPKKIGP